VKVAICTFTWNSASDVVRTHRGYSCSAQRRPLRESIDDYPCKAACRHAQDIRQQRMNIPERICRSHGHDITRLLRRGGVRAVVTESTLKTTTPLHHEGLCVQGFEEHSRGTLQIAVSARIRRFCWFRGPEPSCPTRMRLGVSQVKGSLTRFLTTNSISAVRPASHYMSSLVTGSRSLVAQKSLKTPYRRRQRSPLQHITLYNPFGSTIATHTTFLAYSAPIISSTLFYSNTHKSHIKVSTRAAMSRSIYNSLTGEAGLPGLSTLNAAATPFFMPLTPVMSCNSPLPLVSPRSALRPSAPAFVAPVATMVTPQSSSEHVTETSGASPFEQSWEDDGGLSLAGDATGELHCDFTDLEFDADEIINFAHFDEATDDTQGVECTTLDPTLDGDMVEQHSQTTQCAAALDSDMAVQDAMTAQLPELTQNAAINDEMAAQHPQSAHNAATNDALAAQSPYLAHNAAPNDDKAMQHAQVTCHAATLNDGVAAPDLETAYDAAMNGDMSVQRPHTTHDAVINGNMFVQHLQITHDAAFNNHMAAQHPQFAHDAALNMAAHYPRTTQDAVHSFPMYHSEPVQWTGDAYATDEHYLHPSIEDDFDFGLATATGAQDDGASAYPSPPSLTFGGSSPEDNVRTDTEDGDGEYVEDIDGEGETDDEYQPPEDTNASNTGRNTRSTANTATVDAAPAIEIVQPSFAVKQRKANIIIAKQNAQKDLARSLGQHVRVTHSNGRIEIDGIYWKAPANDFTIPRTDAEKLPYIHTIVNCIRSNENVKEVQTTGSFRHRWADGATYFSDEEVLASACKIVVSVPSTQAPLYFSSTNTITGHHGRHSYAWLDKADLRSQDARAVPEDHVLHIRRAI
jgi:hypothetical protein